MGRNDYECQVMTDLGEDKQIPALQRAFHAELCHSAHQRLAGTRCARAYEVFSQWSLEAALLRAKMAGGR